MFSFFCVDVERVQTPQSVNQIHSWTALFIKNFNTIKEIHIWIFNVLHIKYFPPDETDSAEQQR